MGPLLSVCIPTFNRARELDATLASLRREISLCPKGSVEICVSDNASPDKTRSVVAKWKRLLPVSYSRNRKNMGYDINALRSMQLAKGDYCWFMGDDDAIAGGTLARLVEDIRHSRGRVGAIVVAYSHKGRHYGYGLGGYGIFSAGKPHPPVLIGFLGQVCVRRALAARVARERLFMAGGMLLKREKDRWLLYDYLPTYLLLECMARAGTFGIEPRPGVEVLAAGEAISDEKSMYLGLLSLLYMVQIRKHYPWLCHIDLRRLYLKYHFVKAAIAASAIDRASVATPSLLAWSARQTRKRKKAAHASCWGE